jgi:hypothetical protein
MRRSTEKNTQKREKNYLPLREIFFSITLKLSNSYGLCIKGKTVFT